MSEAITEGVSKLHGMKFNLAALMITGILTLTGCTSYNEQADEGTDSSALPDVTAYSSVAESFRSEDTSASEATTAKPVIDIDSQTVSAGDAASSQTEAVTQVSTETAAAQTELDLTDSSTAPTQAEETTVPLQTEPTTQFQTTKAPVSQANVTAADPQDSTYSPDFFSDDLFIGDSISTGYSLYGFLQDKNVYAKVGLNPSTVLTKSVTTCYGDIDISTMLAYTNPKRVYIMLGSNGIQWLSCESMLSSTDALVKSIKEQCPDTEVVLISVPPVTPDYDSTVDINVMIKIDEYNQSLCDYCKDNQMLYINVAAELKNTSGYFDYSYAESDGLHFKSSAYKIVLSKIQSTVEAYELANPPKSAEESETTAEQTDISEPSDSTEETSAYTTVTEETAANEQQ